MTVEIYHTSFDADLKVDNCPSRLFGSFLFFNDSPCHYGDHVYRIHLNDCDIIDPRDFSEDSEAVRDGINKIMNMCDVDHDDAYDLLCEHETYEDEDYERQADIGWWIQKIIGETACELGFRAAKVRDEHGTSYIVQMFGHCNEMEKV